MLADSLLQSTDHTHWVYCTSPPGFFLGLWEKASCLSNIQYMFTPCVQSVVLDALCKLLYARFTWITIEAANLHIWGSESCWYNHSMYICMLKSSKYSEYISLKSYDKCSMVRERWHGVPLSCGVLPSLCRCAYMLICEFLDKDIIERRNNPPGTENVGFFTLVFWERLY